MGRPPLRLGRPKGRPQAPFQPSHENRYPFTNWSTFAPPKWSKFTPPLTFYLLTSLRLNQFDRSTAIPGLNRDDAYDLVVRLPPLSEQNRIVAKIEELFSELDKGVESLKTARGQLKVYRQAVLKHAFEGKLTAQWREENEDKLETPEQLLARIKQERAEHYEQQLQNWRTAVRAWETKGKPSNKLTKPRKPAGLAQLNSSELETLPPLPEGQVYTYLANLGELERGKSKHRPRNAPKLFGGPYPFIQTGEVKAANRTIRSYSQTYSKFGLKQSGSSGFLVGGQRVAGSSILPTRRRPQSHRSPKGGQEIPKYPTRQSGRGQLVKGIRH